MTPERWHQVERIVHDALARDLPGRAAYLADACAGDEALRQEVESLLAQDPSAGSFLNGPALQAAARALAEADEATVREPRDVQRPALRLSHRSVLRVR
jgi:hypothetical protein